MQMTNAAMISTHGTARIPSEEVLSRSIQILKTVAEVRRAWDASGLPGDVEIEPAPGNRGAVLRVDLPKNDDTSYKHVLSPYEGTSTSQQLESALRQIKGKLETGEVATTTGQTSGRRDD
jgi:hypothetical protein